MKEMPPLPPHIVKLLEPSQPFDTPWNREIDALARAVETNESVAGQVRAIADRLGMPDDLVWSGLGLAVCGRVGRPRGDPTAFKPVPA